MTAAAPEVVPANDLVGLLLSRAPAVERLPVEVLTPAEVALELDRVQRRKAMEAAYEAELVRALAAARPDADDAPPRHPGARRRGGGSPVPGTSEFFPTSWQPSCGALARTRPGWPRMRTSWWSACRRCTPRAPPAG